MHSSRRQSIISQFSLVSSLLPVPVRLSRVWPVSPPGRQTHHSPRTSCHVGSNSNLRPNHATIDTALLGSQYGARHLKKRRSHNCHHHWHRHCGHGQTHRPGLSPNRLGLCNSGVRLSTRPPPTAYMLHRQYQRQQHPTPAPMPTLILQYLHSSCP